MDKEKDISYHTGNGIGFVGSADTAAVRDERDEVHEESNGCDTKEHKRWPDGGRSHPWVYASLD
jgi:hypothetical protein